MVSEFSSDDDRRSLIDSRTREFIENMQDSSYDFLVRGLDYNAYDQNGDVDIMVVNTEDRQVEYFNFYFDSVPQGWDIDVPFSSDREDALNQLLTENGWSYSAHPRRKNRMDVDYQEGIEGDIYYKETADLEVVEQLFDDLSSSKDIKDYELIDD